MTEPNIKLLHAADEAKQAEPMPPKSHSFMADIDAPFVQQILNIAKGQRETDVQHHRQVNNLTARFEIAK